MKGQRKGARKGPTRAEQKAARDAARAALQAKIWTLTGEQEKALREAFEAGPDGSYVGLGSHLERLAGPLVRGDCAELREVTRTVDLHGWRGIGITTATDLYLVPTRYGLSLLGISLLPREDGTIPA